MSEVKKNTNELLGTENTNSDNRESAQKSELELLMEQYLAGKLVIDQDEDFELDLQSDFLDLLDVNEEEDSGIELGDLDSIINDDESIPAEEEEKEPYVPKTPPYVEGDTQRMFHDIDISLWPDPDLIEDDEYFLAKFRKAKASEAALEEEVQKEEQLAEQAAREQEELESAVEAKSPEAEEQAGDDEAFEDAKEHADIEKETDVEIDRVNSESDETEKEENSESEAEAKEEEDNSESEAEAKEEEENSESEAEAKEEEENSEPEAEAKEEEENSEPEAEEDKENSEPEAEEDKENSESEAEEDKEDSGSTTEADSEDSEPEAEADKENSESATEADSEDPEPEAEVKEEEESFEQEVCEEEDNSEPETETDKETSEPETETDKETSEPEVEAEAEAEAEEESFEQEEEETSEPDEDNAGSETEATEEKSEPEAEATEEVAKAEEEVEATYDNSDEEDSDLTADVNNPIPHFEGEDSDEDVLLVEDAPELVMDSWQWNKYKNSKKTAHVEKNTEKDEASSNDPESDVQSEYFEEDEETSLYKFNKTDGMEYMSDAEKEDEEAYQRRRAARKKAALAKKKRRAIIAEILDWIIPVAVAVVLVLLLKSFVIINARIPSGSMENTIMTGDNLLGYRLAYKTKEPERGDIIIFYYPDDESQKYIKRVIGLPGEKVVIQDAKIYIDGSQTPLQEDYLKEEWTVATGYYEFEVPEDCYLMLGDNRNRSEDARYWNNKYVSKDKIIGKALWVYFPFSHWGGLD